MKYHNHSIQKNEETGKTECLIIVDSEDIDSLEEAVRWYVQGHENKKELTVKRMIKLIDEIREIDKLLKPGE